MNRSMNRAIAVMLLLSLIVGTGALAAEVPSDVVGEPCEEAVDYLMDLGVIAGYPDGTIRPDSTITRAEATKVIIVIRHGDESMARQLVGLSPFDDVPGNHWASGHIMLAKNLGIVEGHGTGSYGPEDPVTYAQFAKMLLEAAGIHGNPELTWPDNYVTLAESAGMLDEVPDFTADTPAPRGDCLIMTAFGVQSLVDPATGRTLADRVFGLTPTVLVKNETKNILYATLGEAVADADPGDLITFPEGEVAGNVLIPKELEGLTLQGEGSAKTTVRGDVKVDETQGIVMKGFKVNGDVSVAVEASVDDLHITGSFDAAPAGGGNIARVVVDGDAYFVGSELTVEDIAVGGDAYVGGPNIQFAGVTFGGDVFGAMLQGVEVLKAEGEGLVADHEGEQDAYISVTLGANTDDYVGDMAEGRQITIELPLRIDPDADWTVSNSDTLDLAVLRLNDWQSRVTLTVKSGQTLAGGTTVVVSAPEGILRTTDSPQVTVVRSSTAPWWPFECQWETEFEFAAEEQ